MSKKCRIGVAGAGVFGGYHANKCAAHARIDFIGVFDPNASARDAQAVKHGVSAYADFGHMLADCDAVIIAAPAQYHGAMVLQALDAGRHVLVEKPIATDNATAAQAVKMADAAGLVLQVGHQERFVVRATGLFDVTERPVSITAERLGPFNPRGTDVSVTLDLMTHDLDLVIALMGGMPDRVKGTSEVRQSDHPDYAQGTLYWGEARAQLTASRVADAYSRKMDIRYPSGRVEIDFNAKTLRHDTPFALNTDFAADPQAADSLGAATDSFVSAILDKAPIMVSGQDGANALLLALRIDGHTE